MDIRTEKEELIKRLDRVYDISLIRAIQNLLDFGLRKQIADDQALENSINLGLSQSRKGEVRPHDEVMAEIRMRYKT